MPYYQFPGSDFHDLNLDWLLEQMKNCLAEWAATKTQWETLAADNEAFKTQIETDWEELHTFVTDYFTNLDVSQEISDKIDAMAADGSLLALIDDDVISAARTATSAWLADHIMQETGYVIDASLTIANAAADAKAAGEAIYGLRSNVIAYNGITNLYDSTTAIEGYYNSSGVLQTSTAAKLFRTEHVEVTPGTIYYVNRNLDSITVTFFTEDKTFVSSTTILSGNKITVPATDTISYMAIPVPVHFNGLFVISAKPVDLGFLMNYAADARATETALSLITQTDAAFSVTKASASPYNTNRINFANASPTANGWHFAPMFGTSITACGHHNISFADNATYALVYGPTSGNILRFKKNGALSEVTTIGTAETFTYGGDKVAYRIEANGKTLVVYSAVENKTVTIDISLYVDATYTIRAGLVANRATSLPSVTSTSIANLSGFPYVLTDSNTWIGATWYAYGTSITSTQQGHYVPHLAALSGMTAVNKGIQGGGIGNFGATSTGQVYSAICNTTDGKLNADLITLETGANDCAAGVPLGTIYDTGTETLAGCLNDCIRYLQENTTAQIVVIASPSATSAPNPSTQYYDWRLMIEQICKINNVLFILPPSNLGSAKLSSSSGSDYVVDAIHQTNLGGKVYAMAIWSVLKNQPRFI